MLTCKEDKFQEIRGKNTQERRDIQSYRPKLAGWPSQFPRNLCVVGGDGRGREVCAGGGEICLQFPVLGLVSVIVNGENPIAHYEVAKSTSPAISYIIDDYYAQDL